MRHTGPVQLFKHFSGRLMEERLSTHTKGAYDHKKYHLEEMPIPIIRHLEKHEFPSPERIHGLTWHSINLRGIMASDLLTDKVTVATKAHKKLRHIVLILKVWLISCPCSSSTQLGDTCIDILL